LLLRILIRTAITILEVDRFSIVQVLQWAFLTSINDSNLFIFLLRKATVNSK